MALSTYAELKASVAAWMARDDLTAQIPDFIALAEKHISTVAALRELEASTDLTIDAELVAQPAGFVSARRIYLAGDPRRPLDLVTPFQRAEMWAGSMVGQPRVFAVEGTDLAFSPTPDAAYTGKLLYVRSITALASDGATNALLTNHPSLYLYGALWQAFLFIQDAEGVGLWEMKYREALAEKQRSDMRSKYSGAPLVIRPSVVV